MGTLTRNRLISKISLEKKINISFLGIFLEKLLLKLPGNFFVCIRGSTEAFYRIVVLKNFTKFTGKHLPCAPLVLQVRDLEFYGEGEGFWNRDT